MDAGAKEVCDEATDWQGVGSLGNPSLTLSDVFMNRYIFVDLVIFSVSALWIVRCREALRLSQGNRLLVRKQTG